MEIKLGKRKLENPGPLAICEPVSLPKLNVAEISSTKERFFLDGLILNIYGTYDSDREWRYLRTDLTDYIGFDTVTLVAGSNYYDAHLDKIIVGSCIRVEGAVVVPQTSNDGGSIDYSLQVDVRQLVSW